jgi:hypothetical protein
MNAGKTPQMSDRSGDPLFTRARPDSERWLAPATRADRRSAAPGAAGDAELGCERDEEEGSRQPGAGHLHCMATRYSATGLTAAAACVPMRR